MTESTANDPEQAFEVAGKAGLRLQAWRWGASPRMVVAVHGMNAHGLHWRHFAERLLPAYSLVTYDLRGHGDSDKPETGYTYDDHGDDLEALIDQVTAAPPVLIGHSLGGRIAIPYAARRPLRGLVIVDPGIVPLQAMHAPRDGARRRPDLQFEHESEAAFVERMRRTNFLRNWSPYAEEYARNAIEPDGRGGARLKFREHAHQQIIDTIREVDLFDYLPRIPCPTLVIRATEGHLRADMAERIVNELPNARLAVVEGANHNVMLDKPEIFEPLVEAFIDEMYQE